MIAVTNSLREAIEAQAKSRKTRVTIWMEGDDEPGVDVSYMVQEAPAIQSSIDEASDVSNLIAGSTSCETSFTLQGEKYDERYGSEDFSPFRSSLAAYLKDFGIGMKVKVEQGWGFASIEYITRFVGRVDAVSIDDDTKVTLKCLDNSQPLITEARLPLAVSRTAFPLTAVVETLLRRGGYYQSAPIIPIPDRTRDVGKFPRCILSVPGYLPEVGVMGGPLQGNLSSRGRLERYCGPATSITYEMTEDFSWNSLEPPVTGESHGGKLHMEGWLKLSDPETALVSIGGLVSGSTVPFEKVVLSVDGGTLHLKSGPIDFTAPIVRDSEWHYLQVTLWRQGPIRCRFNVDGNITNRTSSVNVLTVPKTRVCVLSGALHEGFAVYRWSGNTVLSFPADRSDWVPNIKTTYLGAPSLIKCVPREVDEDNVTAWEVIKGAATATGAKCRFTEGGDWRWEERSSLVARRVAPVNYVIHEDTNYIDGGLKYDGSSRKRSVELDWFEYNIYSSKVPDEDRPDDKPLFELSETDPIPGLKKTVLDFDFDQYGFALRPLRQGSAGPATGSYFQVVEHRLVGDPSAPVRKMPEGSVTMIPTAKGCQVTIQNPFSYPIAFWDPATENAAFTVHGQYASSGKAERKFKRNASNRSTEDLVVPSSRWRQSAAFVRSLASNVAKEVGEPIVMFDTIKIKADGRLTVDDIISLQVDTLMARSVACQIVSMTVSDEEYELTVRLCYTLTGWILGIPERSILGTSTILT